MRPFIRQAVGVLAIGLLAGCGGGGGSAGDSSPRITSLNNSSAKVNQPITFWVTGQNLPGTVMLAMADSDCTAPTHVTSTDFSVTCTPTTAGVKAITIKGSDAGAVIDASRSIEVTTASTVVGTLPHTGVKTTQCYASGSNTLVACNSSGALNLSGAGKQDGMQTTNAARYSLVGITYPVTMCVKDEITGLIWEGKEASGRRSGENTYTNYSSTSSPQKPDGVSFPTQAELDADTNAMSYVKYVNQIGLCGFTDWRLPTVHELETLHNGGLTENDVADSTWFPNTPRVLLWWTSTPSQLYTQYGWFISFGGLGQVYYDTYAADYNVRLVRSAQ